MELYQLGVILLLLALGLVVIGVLIVRRKRAAAMTVAEQDFEPQTQTTVAAEESPIAKASAKLGSVRRAPVDDARMSQRLQDLGQRNRDLPSAPFREQVEERLTAAFDLFEQQRITLDTFKKLVRAEHAEAQRRLDAFSDGSAYGDAQSDDIAEVTTAYEMTEQCLNWAEDFGGSAQRA